MTVAVLSWAFIALFASASLLMLAKAWGEVVSANRKRKNLFLRHD